MTMLQVFASAEGNKEYIYPITISAIALEQRTDHELKAYFKDKNR